MISSERRDVWKRKVGRNTAKAVFKVPPTWEAQASLLFLPQTTLELSHEETRPPIKHQDNLQPQSNHNPITIQWRPQPRN